MLAKLIRTLLYRLDVNKGVAFEAASMPAAMRRMIRRGLTINTVIDIGASNGQWSQEAMTFFPEARYLLIEAQAAHRDALDGFARVHKNATYVLKAAGSEIGTVYFDAGDPFAGQADTASKAGFLEVAMTTIDSEVQREGLPGPFLLKFDVHGFELPILAGAAATLAETELIVMECYNFEIGSRALLFHDMCSHMAKIGFRVIDICEPLWRPSDEALWQFDLFFARSSRPEFKVTTYLPQR